MTGRPARSTKLFVLAAAILASGARAEDLTLVRPDGPLPLVLAAEGQVHQDAAADLCEYLGRVSGRPIEPGAAGDQAAIAIHVGPDAFVVEHVPEVQGLFADGFVLKHVVVDQRNHVVLAGTRLNASRWAVEEFLRRFCGVRWLFPDPVYGEIVPDRPVVTVPAGLDEKHEPDHLSRSNLGMYYFDKARRYLRLRPFGWAFGSHEFQHMFTREDYEAHPDWFALFTIPERWAKAIGSGQMSAAESVVGALGRGVRRQRWHWNYGNGWQICLSNRETVEHAVAYAREYLAKNPESPIVSMGHNDTSGWCECDLCQAFAASVDPPYTVSERYWHWVNQVARDLGTTHPDKLVDTIAYGEPMMPPRFDLEQNIAVTLTVYHQSHLDLVPRWRQKCGSLNLYQYAFGWFFLGFRHYPAAMRDFIRWGHDELGAISFVAEVGGNWTFDGPKYHYMQAFQWDVGADPDKLMAELCRDWYGSAQSAMKAFWDRLEAIYERRGAERRFLFYQWLGWNETYDELDPYTLADVEFLDGCIGDAERAAAGEGDRFRVARVADAWRYFRTYLLGKLKFADREPAVLAEAAADPARGLELARELAELQEQRSEYFRKLRTYPHINVHMADEGYLALFSQVSVFADMATLLDALCDQATGRLVERDGRESAVRFWRQFGPADPLWPSAAAQVHQLANTQRPNILANGDFETGDLAGWQSDGEMACTEAGPRGGRFAAQGGGTLSQAVAVRPGDRLRLSARGRYLAAPPPGALLFATAITFQGGGRDQTLEPAFRRRKRLEPDAGYAELRTTFTVPPDAEAATIALMAADQVVRWDDIVLERIQAGPVVTPGELADGFVGDRLDEDRWIDSPAGRSGDLPVFGGGRLRLGEGLNATLVSRSTFDELLGRTGGGRYRLRVHVARGAGPGPASFDCGITTGTMPISIDHSGFWFTHVFAGPDGAETPLRMYWYQDAKSVAGPWQDVGREMRAAGDMWYTFRFDPAEVCVYAGIGGYDESEQALLCRYEHKMSDIASRGPVHLKISGANVQLDEISLARPGGSAADRQPATEPIAAPAGR